MGSLTGCAVADRCVWCVVLRQVQSGGVWDGVSWVCRLEADATQLVCRGGRTAGPSDARAGGPRQRCVDFVPASRFKVLYSVQVAPQQLWWL